jgi:hypothetical protein
MGRKPLQKRTLAYVAGLWIFGSLVFACLLPAVFPVSFREDDAGYLAWAAGATGPLAAWDLQGGMLFGMFRPVVNLWWYGLYHIAGFESFRYHFALSAVYALMLGAFVFAGSAIHGKRTGALALLLWLAVFYFLQYVLFWFSGYVYLLETAFLAAAAGFAALAIRGSFPNSSTKPQRSGDDGQVGVHRPGRRASCRLVLWVCSFHGFHLRCRENQSRVPS